MGSRLSGQPGEKAGALAPVVGTDQRVDGKTAG